MLHNSPQQSDVEENDDDEEDKSTKPSAETVLIMSFIID